MAKDSVKSSASKTVATPGGGAVSKAVEASAVKAASGPKKMTVDEYNRLPKSKDTQLLPAVEFDWNRFVIFDPVLYPANAGIPAFYRAKVGYVYPNNTTGTPIFSLSKKYCFGVQADNVDKDGKVTIDKDTGKERQLRGYKVPIVLASGKEEPSDEETAELEFFSQLQAHVQKWAYENRASIGKVQKKEAEIHSLVPHAPYRSLDLKGNFKEGAPYMYSSALSYFAKDKKCETRFYDENDQEVDPLTVKSHCWIVPTIRIDSIFINGKTIAPQLKMYDAAVSIIQRGNKTRLAPKITAGNTNDVPPEDDDDDDNNSNSNSSNDSANEIVNSDDDDD